MGNILSLKKVSALIQLGFWELPTRLSSAHIAWQIASSAWLGLPKSSSNSSLIRTYVHQFVRNIHPAGQPAKYYYFFYNQ